MQEVDDPVLWKEGEAEGLPLSLGCAVEGAVLLAEGQLEGSGGLALCDPLSVGGGDGLAVGGVLGDWVHDAVLQLLSVALGLDGSEAVEAPLPAESGVTVAVRRALCVRVAASTVALPLPLAPEEALSEPTAALGDCVGITVAGTDALTAPLPHPELVPPAAREGVAVAVARKKVGVDAADLEVVPPPLPLPGLVEAAPDAQ